MLKKSVIFGAIGLLTLTGSIAMADDDDEEGRGLRARVRALEALVAGLTNPVTEITVDCAAGDTITNAISQGTSAVPLTITVVGTCTGEPDPVEISRDAVTIQGSSLSGAGDPVDTLVGGFNILSSDRITIKDMILRDGVDAGIFARRGSSITIENVKVSGFPTAGIGILRHSFAHINKADVNNPAGGIAALFANDGSVLRVTNSKLVSQSAAQFNEPAVALYRLSHARFDQGNTIENTNTDPDPTKAMAINVLDVSNLRIQGAGNTVTGNILLESNSAADFRGVAMTGQFKLQGKAHTTMNNNASLNGDIFVDTQSLLEAFGGSGQVTGTVTCTRDSAVSGGAVGGFTLVGCPVL